MSSIEMSNNSNKSTTPGWRCTLCSEPFSEDQLEKHIQDAHIGRPQASWKCGQCAFLTGSLGKIGAHFVRTGHSPKLVIQMNEYTQYPLRFFNCLDSILVHQPEKIEVPVANSTLGTTISEGINQTSNKKKRKLGFAAADSENDAVRDDRNDGNEDPATAALWASLSAVAAKKTIDYSTSLEESTADGQQQQQQPKFDLLTPAQIIPVIPSDQQHQQNIPKAVPKPSDESSFSSLWSLTVDNDNNNMGSPPAPQTVQRRNLESVALGSSSSSGQRGIKKSAAAIIPLTNCRSGSSSSKRKADSAAKKSGGAAGRQRKGESAESQKKQAALLTKNTAEVKEEPMGVADDSMDNRSITADDSLSAQKESSKEVIAVDKTRKSSMKSAIEVNHSSLVLDGGTSSTIEEEEPDEDEEEDEDRKPDLLLPEYHQAGEGGNTVLLPPKYKYRCDMCDRNFTTNSNWRRHERDVHHREKRTPKPVPTPEEREAETIKVTKAVFICRKCNDEFRTPQALKEHMEVSGVRRHIEIDQPFACPLCPRRFSREASLKIHASLHPTTGPSYSSHLPSSDVISMGGGIKYESLVKGSLSPASNASNDY